MKMNIEDIYKKFYKSCTNYYVHKELFNMKYSKKNSGPSHSQYLK